MDLDWGSVALVGQNKTTTVGDETLIVDYMPNIAIGQVVIATMLTFLGTLSTRQPDTRGTPPNSGLFLCPPGTPSESITQATAGINVDARPIPLPLNDPYLNVASVGPAPSYALQMITAPGLFVIPATWFVRAIILCNSGSATPGPGANSVGRLSLFGSIKGNCSC